MKLYQWTREVHGYVGVALCLVLATSSVTGFLLLVKKEFATIQPPVMPAAEGMPEDFVSIARVLESARATGDPAFATLADIDRIDFRPADRVHKVRSKTGYREVQVDAVTGEVLSHTWRPSDLIEAIHDGSWFASMWHDYGMPLAALGLLFLSATGLYLWLTPVLRRRRRARQRP